MQNQSKIDYLSSEIERHRNLYYNEQPEISDAAFDVLEAELKSIAPNHAALKKVGAEVPSQEEWKKAEHKLPLGSLDKVKNPEEFEKWVLDTFKSHNTLFVIEKLDGLSIEVVYENGLIKQCISRGNGYTGFEMSANVVRMNGVKRLLPVEFTGSLRGEIILKRSNHKKFFPEYPNPRNAAVGISKRLDGSDCKHLDVVFYQAVGNKSLKTEYEQLQFIKNELRLQVPEYHLVDCRAEENGLTNSIKMVNAIWEEYQSSIREKTDYDLDGLVVRVNELDDQKALGETHLRSKGARAYKFRSEEAVTKVVAIHIQVGPSGRITPVLEIEPVRLAGAEIWRASLYNFSYIEELGIDVGAKVIVSRAGDVIPRCEAVLEPTGTVFKTPLYCPACRCHLEFEGKNLLCKNTDICRAQTIGRIQNWIRTLNILEWGEKLLYKLIENGMVITVNDLYKLSVKDLASVERMGLKSAENCYNSLWSHNPIPLEQFLGGLSIPMVGTATINILKESGFKTLNQILGLKPDQLMQIKGIGPTKARTLFDGLNRNRELIAKLLEAGLKIEENQKIVGGKLARKSFIFTGTMVNKRSVLEEMVVKNGGEVKGSVSKNLDYLVIADHNTAKAAKARQYGIKLISEDEFLKMVAD